MISRIVKPTPMAKTPASTAESISAWLIGGGGGSITPAGGRRGWPGGGRGAHPIRARLRARISDFFIIYFSFLGTVMSIGCRCIFSPAWFKRRKNHFLTAFSLENSHQWY